MQMHFNHQIVLLTGHTGFKGSWLAAWLHRLGAEVVALSDTIPTEPAHYDLIKDVFADDRRIDIRDGEAVYQMVKEVKPDFLFHLAAQPIVLESYKNPLATFQTNTMGTANILDALRRANHECVAVMITSDKCYDNVEWTWGYREMDRLGGKDPYSGSKGAAELVIRSYVASFFNKPESNVRIAVGRAGNVIGGGDWAPYRIIPDCIRAWAAGKNAEIRSPHSTRPWQHVLDPLSGYITLAVALKGNADLNGEPFNFGPPSHQNFSVAKLVDEISCHWSGAKWEDVSDQNATPHEAGLLKLNCDKALHSLGWQTTLNFKETVEWTGEWYRTYYEEGPAAAELLTTSQIEQFVMLATRRNKLKVLSNK